MRWSLVALLALSGLAHAQSPRQNAEAAFDEVERESVRYREAELPVAVTPRRAEAAIAPPKSPATQAPPARPATEAPARPASMAPATQAPPARPAAKAPATQAPVTAAAPPPLTAQPGGDLDAVLDLRRLDHALLAHAIVLETNDARQRHGLRPLPVERRLNAAAQLHAERMAQLDFFDHNDPHDARYRTPKDRAAQAGITNPHIAENILTGFALQHDGGPLYVIDRARGQFSRTPRGPAIARHTYRSFAKRSVERWLLSPGHRRNLLSKNGLQMGAGAAVMPPQADGFPKLTGVQVFQWFEPAR
ncbi:MAG: CAP domain-containing protein [Myxococcales bacterium]|nr:CAP domain-containing protein [Myxococcales bacterium]